MMDVKLDLIKEEDKALVGKAEKFFASLHQGHTDFQIKHFILKDEENPLPDSKYYQAMLEVYGRYENLVQQHYEHRKIENEIRLLELDIAEMSSYVMSCDRRQILSDMKRDEITMKKLHMKSVEKAVKSICREMKCFVGCMEELKPQLKYKDYESMQKHHWLLVHRNQKAANKQTCSIPKEMLQDEANIKLIEDSN